MTEWRIGICGKCGRLVRRLGPVDYAVCDNGHPILDTDLTFEFSPEDQKTIKNLLQRLRRRRKKLGRNPNDLPLTVDSIIAMVLLLGFEGTKKMNVPEVLQLCEKYGTKP